MNKLLIAISLLFVIGNITAEEILIKIKDSRSFVKEELTAGGLTFSIEPLIPSRNGIIQDWFVATTNERTDKSPWDLAHQLVEENEEIIYGEPNCPTITKGQEQLAESLSKELKESRGYNEEWPHPDKNSDVFAWHLQEGYSQLKDARKKGSYKGGDRIRVAHFDTGYDPNHISTPKNVCGDLERNYVKGENPNSSIDPNKDGILEQPGHGTGTLSILAGNLVTSPDQKFADYMGGAPEVEIVPIRLSNSVLLFQAKEFAQALDYAVSINCDVLSMSMGGVASKLWAESVNAAYEKGLVMVTAAGNNVAGGLPTKYLVYPAKFKRVIAACGVCYDHTPYFKTDPWFVGMQGNHGPQKLMGSAIAAYTPNITWARIGEKDKISISGGGTSSATPQVASAVALWLQKYNNFQYDQPWQRVNAVRNALFSTAKKDLAESAKYYGNGVLRASEALDVAPIKDSQKIPKDEVFLPYLSLLFGWETRSEINEEMISVELLQLEQNNSNLAILLENLDGKTTISEQERSEIFQVIKNIPEASSTLIELTK